jgi:hypothetical protein
MRSTAWYQRCVDDERVSVMPLYWTIDSRARLITARAEGDVSLADALALLEAMSGACALSYRKIFDGRAGAASLTGEEILALSAKIRSYHEQGVMGALAMVATPDQTQRFARVLGALATADRPMKVFSEFRQARKWIDAQPNARADLQVPMKVGVRANGQARGQAANGKLHA